MKKWTALLALVLLLMSLCSCGETKTVTCDRCGKTIELNADSKIEEDWIVFCKECEEEAFGDNPVVSPE